MYGYVKCHYPTEWAVVDLNDQGRVVAKYPTEWAASDAVRDLNHGIREGQSMRHELYDPDIITDGAMAGWNEREQTWSYPEWADQPDPTELDMPDPEEVPP